MKNIDEFEQYKIHISDKIKERFESKLKSAKNALIALMKLGQLGIIAGATRDALADMDENDFDLFLITELDTQQILGKGIDGLEKGNKDNLLLKIRSLISDFDLKIYKDISPDSSFEKIAEKEPIPINSIICSLKLKGGEVEVGNFWDFRGGFEDIKKRKIRITGTIDGLYAIKLLFYVARCRKSGVNFEIDAEGRTKLNKAIAAWDKSETKETRQTLRFILTAIQQQYIEQWFNICDLNNDVNIYDILFGGGISFKSHIQKNLKKLSEARNNNEIFKNNLILFYIIILAPQIKKENHNRRSIEVNIKNILYEHNKRIAIIDHMQDLIINFLLEYNEMEYSDKYEYQIKEIKTLLAEIIGKLDNLVPKAELKDEVEVTVSNDISMENKLNFKASIQIIIPTSKEAEENKEIPTDKKIQKEESSISNKEVKILKERNEKNAGKERGGEEIKIAPKIEKLSPQKQKPVKKQKIKQRNPINQLVNGEYKKKSSEEINLLDTQSTETNKTTFSQIYARITAVGKYKPPLFWKTAHSIDPHRRNQKQAGKIIKAIISQKIYSKPLEAQSKAITSEDLAQVNYSKENSKNTSITPLRDQYKTLMRTRFVQIQAHMFLSTFLYLTLGLADEQVKDPTTKMVLFFTLYFLASAGVFYFTRNPPEELAREDAQRPGIKL